MNKLKHQVITLLAAPYADETSRKDVHYLIKDSGEEDKSKRGFQVPELMMYDSARWARGITHGVLKTWIRVTAPFTSRHFGKLLSTSEIMEVSRDFSLADWVMYINPYIPPCVRNRLKLKYPRSLHFELAHSCISFCPCYLPRLHRLEVLSVAPCSLDSVPLHALTLWPQEVMFLCSACPRWHSPQYWSKKKNPPLEQQLKPQHEQLTKDFFFKTKSLLEVIGTSIRSDAAERGPFKYAVWNH